MFIIYLNKKYKYTNINAKYDIFFERKTVISPEIWMMHFSLNLYRNET